MNRRDVDLHSTQAWRTQGPFIFEEVVEQKVCQEMLASFAQGQAQARTFNGLLQRDFRCADFIILGRKFLPVFESFVKEHLEPALGIQCALEFPHLPILYRYPIGPGFKVHHDMVNKQEIDEAKVTGQPIMGGDITTILGINHPSEYRGGELFFPNHDVSLKFNPGTLVVYPNTKEFLHGVTPITEGERYSVVCRVNVAV